MVAGWETLGHSYPNICSFAWLPPTSSHTGVSDEEPAAGEWKVYSDALEGRKIGNKGVGLNI